MEAFPMKYGFIHPGGDARTVADLAQQAEAAGWDGFFLPEPVWHNDAWICLTAAAMCTQRIRLGTMLTPLPRMRPWRVASQTATLDNLSNGRVILSLGIGWLLYGYQAFLDEATDRRTRTELLDEGIDLLTLLYRGEPFTYSGKHYHVDLTKLDPMYYPPRPVQQPRPPLWTVGVWPRRKSMQRVLKCDGLIPAKMNPAGEFVQVQPEDLREMRDYISANRQLETPFDYLAEGETGGLSKEQATERIGPWQAAGATWWMEAGLFGKPQEQILERLHQGPPILA
jgi:alkanesulfonate monooxygenase SsuD/methylene tetrahydromethanopterin reductase-like flavin-dependent oxidoreductase (luciferase family)